jgi:hypothetical protein
MKWTKKESICSESNCLPSWCNHHLEYQHPEIEVEMSNEYYQLSESRNRSRNVEWILSIVRMRCQCTVLHSMNRKCDFYHFRILILDFASVFLICSANDWLHNVQYTKNKMTRVTKLQLPPSTSISFVVGALVFALIGFSYLHNNNHLCHCFYHMLTYFLY